MRIKPFFKTQMFVIKIQNERNRLFIPFLFTPFVNKALVFIYDYCYIRDKHTPFWDKLRKSSNLVRFVIMNIALLVLMDNCISQLIENHLNIRLVD